MQTSVAAYHSSVSDEDDRALAAMFVAYTVTAAFWLLFATAVGVLLAYKFGAPAMPASVFNLTSSEPPPLGAAGHDEWLLAEALAETFPASDPIAVSLNPPASDRHA